MSVFSTFAANTPQLYIEVAREKAQALGVAVGDIFAALQASLGGSYVNDFNAFGRVWQVNIQAEAADRAKVDGHLPHPCAGTAPATWCRCARWSRCGWSWGRNR